MTTLDNLIQETQRRFLSDLREEVDTLGATTLTQNLITLSAGQSLGSIQPGAILQIDYELMLVLSAPSPSAITVKNGYLGSITAPYHVGGAIITVNPRFPAVDMIKAFNEELDDLSAPTNGLYQVKEVTLSYNPVIVGYDLTDINTMVAIDPSTWIDIVEVRAHEYGPAQRWPHTPLGKVQIMRNQDTTQFPSGNALRFDGVGYAGRPIRVLYKSTFTSNLVNSTDDVQGVSGLHPQAHDILTLGAALRLMQWRELKRSFTETQSEPRRAQEVPVGSSLTAIKGIMQHRLDRIAAERSRLDSMYRRVWK